MTQRMLSRLGWTAGASGLVLTAAALAGASGVVANAALAGPQAMSVHLAFSCRSQPGTWPVGVTVAATFPSAVGLAKPIRPTGLRTTVTLPSSAVTDLVKLGAAQVTGSDVLTAGVTYAAHRLSTPWAGRLAKPVPIPGAGRLLFQATGPVQPVATTSPGTVTFTVADLALVLTPRKADGSPASSAPLNVACTLNRGQDGRLATVPVSDASPQQGVSPPPSSATTPPPAGRATLPASHDAFGKPPPGCGAIKIKSPQTACGYITGYANVNKLNGAALLQPPSPQKPGLVNIAESVSIKHVPGGVILNNIGQLYYRGHEELPPVQTTFLGFGFVPITATLHVIELKPIKIAVFLHNIVQVKVTTSTEVSFRISNVTVNGVPWKSVGSNCRTKTPIHLKLIGTGNASTQRGFWNLLLGGTLGGMVTVPPFAGCGVGENLDPLFTASISGPRNFDLMTQGPLCIVRPLIPATCPPSVPKPSRRLIGG
jgi:hypothetical protein